MFSLEEGKGAQQYAGDLAQSLGNQPEYREITVSTKTLGDESVGVVEYLFDQIDRGRVETTRHVEYIFVGQGNRYHLDFSMAEDEFSNYQTVFTSMAEQFTYLGENR